MTTIVEHRCANGLEVRIEPISGMKSLALMLKTPAGVGQEALGSFGTCNILSDVIFRGAGEWDARSHSEALDRLGIRRDSSSSNAHLGLSSTMIGERFADALPLLAAMIEAPHLTEENFKPAQDLAIQSIESLEDEPRQKVFIALREYQLGDPQGRSRFGKKEDIEKMSAQTLVDFHGNYVKPEGAIFSLAGNIDPDTAIPLIEAQFANWTGGAEQPAPGDLPAFSYNHVHAESTQQHIALAYPTRKEIDEDSILQKVAVACLSGGMSGRLFTEVREKRGLCYAVMASYGSNPYGGFVSAYSGTTTERAEETLKVLAGELVRMKDGVTADEFERAIIGLKSRLVMQGESTSARAAAMANDWYLRGRARGLEEIAAMVDAVTLDQLNAWLAEFKIPGFTIVNVGPQPLECADEVMASVQGE